MDVCYIVIQAGGKGTRLGYLTKNKPKALVPVGNLPMIFYLFKKFKDKKFIIIGDYKKEVFKEYLRAFADVKYIFTEAKGERTCAGLGQALKFIPEGKAFMYIWSDLVLSEEFVMPEEENNYIGISGDFECRWSCRDGRLTEENSIEDGVAGLFIFKDKREVCDVPESGEFVAYLQKKGVDFERIVLSKTKEYGRLSEYKKLKTEKCRPFNSIEEVGDKIIKRGITKQGEELAGKETAWYKKAAELGYGKIPKIYKYEPLEMEKIKGKNIYEYNNLSKEEKEKILDRLIESLNELHDLDSAPTDMFSVKKAYIDKTFERLNKIRDLVPFAKEKYININGRKCENAFFLKNEIERQIMSYEYKDFKFIHGDCTFSNMLLDEKLKPVLIDPRGYFGDTALYGDADYDWAKLYYSLKGNYDKFNLKKFVLEIGDNGEILLNIESNGWEDAADCIFKAADGICEEKIKLLHAVIWLSLTTYAWQDFDSICAAFYNGCYYLEEAIK